MANNVNGGYDGPSPDYVPDENVVIAENVGENANEDLDPMVFLEKLQKVQDHFDRQMECVQQMLTKMETRALNAETALAHSERSIESLVGFNTSLVDRVTSAEKAVEAGKKKVDPAVVGKKKSVTIATGPDTVSSQTVSPTHVPRRNNDSDGGKSSAVNLARGLNKTPGISTPDGLYSPIGRNSLDISDSSLNFCGESSPPNVVGIKKPVGRLSLIHI